MFSLLKEKEITDREKGLFPSKCGTVPSQAEVPEKVQFHKAKVFSQIPKFIQHRSQ